MSNLKFDHKHNGFRGNVMTPLNWFTGITETVLLPTAAINYENWLGIACFIVGASIFIFYAVVYCIWMKKDPNRLQTEGFNLHAAGLTVKADVRDVTATGVSVKSGNILDVQADRSYQSIDHVAQKTD